MKPLEILVAILILDNLKSFFSSKLAMCKILLILVI